MQDFKEIWGAVKSKIHNTVGETAMSLWIDTIKPVRFESNAAVLMTENDFHKDVVLSKYSNLLKSTISEVMGFDVSIKVVTSADKKYQTKVDNFNSNVIEERLASAVDFIHPEYTFDNFIVGDSNNHSFAAAQAVAKMPALAYNPLFLHGNTGLGKTHLLYAIKNEIDRNNPHLKTLVVNCEDFTNEFISSLQNNTVYAFREKYRAVDALFVDDIQFLAGKNAVQEEFFHTFNTMYEAHKQIVLVSDRPPKDIPLLAERLRSRFESGLLSDIVAPEYELKVAIIKQKTEAYNVALPPEVIEFVAMRVKNNIRQLEGVVKKIMACQLISKAPPNIAMAQSAIRDIVSENEPIEILADKVIAEVARMHDVAIDDVKSKKRQSNLTAARQIAMYILRNITTMSLPEIGHFFSDRDHSTVYHSIAKVEEKVSYNSALRSQINDIIKNVKE